MECRKPEANETETLLVINEAPFTKNGKPYYVSNQENSFKSLHQDESQLVDCLLGIGEEQHHFRMLDDDRQDFDFYKKELIQKLLDEALSSKFVKISRAQKRT